MKQNRFKSWALWVSVSALLGMFLNDVGLVESVVFDTYIEKILYILALAGIINSPTNKDKF